MSSFEFHEGWILVIDDLGVENSGNGLLMESRVSECKFALSVDDCVCFVVHIIKVSNEFSKLARVLNRFHE